MPKFAKSVRKRLSGADFICGFPTETEEQFANTLKLVDEAGITKLHVFPYSDAFGNAGGDDAAGSGRSAQGTGAAAAYEREAE